MPKKRNAKFAPIRVRAVDWLLVTPRGRHTFESLSQMRQWLTSHPVQDHELVTIKRGSRVIYCGLWGEVLQDAPTLL